MNSLRARGTPHGRAELHHPERNSPKKPCKSNTEGPISGTGGDSDDQM